MSPYRSIGVFAILLLLITSCTTTTSPATTTTAKVKNSPVLLIAEEQSADMELMLTKEVGVMVSMLEKAGYKVVVASKSGQPIKGTNTTLNPDLKLADVKVEDYAGIMVPCMGVDLDPPLPPVEAVEIVKKAVALGKPIAAQVGGIFILNAAGALDGKQFALYNEFYNDLKYFLPKGIYKGNGVVQDGNIITSGVCPMVAEMTGLSDGTTQLTKKFIDTLASLP